WWRGTATPAALPRPAAPAGRGTARQARRPAWRTLHAISPRYNRGYHLLETAKRSPLSPFLLLGAPTRETNPTTATPLRSSTFLGVYEDPDRELREELDLALASVSAPLRDAVRLRYLEGLSQLEAAAVLGVPRGTLSQRAAKGLRRLRFVLTG